MTSSRSKIQRLVSKSSPMALAIRTRSKYMLNVSYCGLCMLDFTLKLLSDQTEVSVHTDDLETLQGLLRELRRSHLIARKDMRNNHDNALPEQHNQRTAWAYWVVCIDRSTVDHHDRGRQFLRRRQHPPLGPVLHDRGGSQGYRYGLLFAFSSSPLEGSKIESGLPNSY